MTYSVSINFYNGSTWTFDNVQHVRVEQSVVVLTTNDDGRVVVPLAAFFILAQQPNETS